MGTRADCEAYIDKLESFGQTYSPGRLLLRPIPVLIATQGVSPACFPERHV